MSTWLRDGLILLAACICAWVLADLVADTWGAGARWALAAVFAAIWIALAIDAHRRRP